LEWYVSEYEHEDPLWVHFVSIWSRPTGIRGTCPFLSNTGCTLTYQDKPFICRIYPLDFNITWGGISPPKSTHCPVARLARSNEEVVGHFGDDWKALECGFGEFRQELISLLGAISDHPMKQLTTQGCKHGRWAQIAGCRLDDQRALPLNCSV
jgi:hypothetical protein